MPLLMSQALARTREQVYEPTAAQWTDPELRRWIMEGARDVARRARCLRGVATVVSVAQQADYTITTRLVELTHVEYFAASWPVGRPLTYVDVTTKASFGYSPGSFPQFYTTWGEPPSMTLTLHPAPSASAESIKLFYYRLPADVAYDGTQDANTVEIPEGWDDLIYLYAESCARRRDNNMEQYQLARGEYEQKLQELTTVSIRYNDQAGQVIDDWHGGRSYAFGPYGGGR